MNLLELEEQKRNLELQLKEINREIKKIKDQFVLDRYNLALCDLIECNGIKGQVFKIVGDYFLWVRELKKDGTVGNKKRRLYLSDLEKGITKI